jgi:hypothetical protein
MKIQCLDSFKDNFKLYSPSEPNRQQIQQDCSQDRAVSPGVTAPPEVLVEAPAVHNESHQALQSSSTTYDSYPPVFPEYDQYVDGLDDCLTFPGSWDFDFSFEPFVDYSVPNNATTPTTTANEVLHRTEPQTFSFEFVNSTGWDMSTAINENAKASHRMNSAIPISTKRKNVNENTSSKTKRVNVAKPDQWTPDNPTDITLTTSNKDTDQFFIKHYDACIRSGISLKDGADWNYHAFVRDFIKQCDSESPFRLAVLAWSARHYSEYTASNTSWKSYYTKASSAVQDLMERGVCSSQTPVSPAPVSTSAEVIICSAIFLCRCEVLSSDYSSLHRRLRQLRDWLSTYAEKLSLSAFACKVLILLSYLHVRNSIFSPALNHSSTMLDVVIRLPNSRSIFKQSTLYLAEIFGEAYPKEELAQDEELEPVLSMIYEVFCLISSMLQYRSWTLKSSMSENNDHELSSAKEAAINADIRRISAEFSLAIATQSSASVLRDDSASLDASSRVANNQPDKIHVDRAGFHWFSCYGGFLTSKILWSRILYPDIRTDESSTSAVKTILNIAIRMKKTKSRKVLRSALWPLPLFVAGIETTDDVYVDWITTCLEETTCSSMRRESTTGKEAWKASQPEGGGQSGGIKGAKVVKLLELVRQKQNKVARRLEVEKVIQEISMDSGLFVF